MSERRLFTEAELTEALNEIGSNLERKISIYLLGGCAMTFIGRKAATKDVDLVLTSTEDVKALSYAAEQAGFHYVQELPEEYDALGAWVIMENEAGMRLDVFDRQVSHGLIIDEDMRKRAGLYGSFGNLDVYLMSNEDIFLFKGITERESDLEDLRMLAETGLNWETIEKECLAQEESGTWAYRLWSRLMELRSRYGINTPIAGRLRDHSDLELIKRVFTDIIGERRTSFSEVADEIGRRYGYSSSWTRQQLKILATQGILVVEKEGRRNTYRVSPENRT